MPHNQPHLHAHHPHHQRQHHHPATQQSRRPGDSPFDRQRALQSPTASSSSPSVAAGGVHDGDAEDHQQQQQLMQTCGGCHRPIAEKYLLRAVDQYWHEDCLKCACCDCRLGEVGNTLFTKAELLLCRRDYLRLFGATGLCSACTKTISAFEFVMRAKGNVYHLDCFACQQCNHRFCIGDRYYLCDNKILCQFDYDERMVMASLSRGREEKQTTRGLPDVVKTTASTCSSDSISVIPPTPTTRRQSTAPC